MFSLSGFSAFLSQFKNMHMRSIGDSLIRVVELNYWVETFIGTEGLTVETGFNISLDNYRYMMLPQEAKNNGIVGQM